MRAAAAAVLVLVAGASKVQAQSASSMDLPGFEEVEAGYRALEAWRYDEARTLAEGLLKERSDDPLVLALLADVKLHHGDYAGALALYDEAYRAGVPEFLIRNRSLAEAARSATEDFDEVISERFVLRHPRGRDAILQPYALETLERSLDRLAEYFGFRPEGRILVEFYPSAQTLAQVSSLSRSDIENSGTIALCKWNRLMVTSPRGVVFGYAWRDTLSHELAHLLIGGASRNQAPIWLHEGLAKYVETAWRGEPGHGISVDQQKALRKAARTETLITFEQMHPSMAKLPSQEQTSLAFAEVFTFVEYLVAEGGWERIRRVLERIAQGATDRAAIAQVYGMPFETLEARWKKSLLTRPIRAPSQGRMVKGARPIQLKSSPDAPDDDLAGLDAQSRRHARAADLLYARGRIPAAMEELRRAHARSPSPQLAGRLAQVALQAGDLTTAEGAAREAVESSVGLAGPSVTLAQILVQQEKTEQAVEPLQRAIDVNPFDPRIHQLLRIVHRDDPEAVSHAVEAIEWMSGPVRLTPRSLGQGARVRIEGPPFARVFVAHGDGPFIPTRTLTPTSILEVRPGRTRIKLVPPRGRPIEKGLEILPAPDGEVQVVVAEATGS